VFDFGALSPDTEKLYIKAMLRRQLALFVRNEKEKKEERRGQTARGAAAQAAEQLATQRAIAEAAAAEAAAAALHMDEDAQLAHMLMQEQEQARLEAEVHANRLREEEQRQEDARLRDLQALFRTKVSFLPTLTLP
jgi:hypothetical protein